MRTEIEDVRKIVHAFSRSRGEDSLIQLVLPVIVLSNKVIIYLFIYLFKHIKLGQIQIDRLFRAETQSKHTEF